MKCLTIIKYKVEKTNLDADTLKKGSGQYISVVRNESLLKAIKMATYKSITLTILLDVNKIQLSQVKHRISGVLG